MQDRTPGRAGIRVSTLALGATNLGAIGRTRQDEATAVADTAPEGGLDVIDTADVHGGGASEETHDAPPAPVGPALGRRR